MSKVIETEVEALKRVYPHVDDIEDWRAQQSIRLLWDRVFDLTAQLKAAQATVGDLVNAQHAHDDAVKTADRKADEALALAQLTKDEKGEIVTGGGGQAQVTVLGRFWMKRTEIYRPRFISGFRLPGLAVTNPTQVTTYLDMAVSLGFNGVRVLAGRLTWGPQTVEEARQGLPFVMDEAKKRELAVEVTAVTDSYGVDDATPAYNIPGHIDAIGKIAARYTDVVCEVANEPWHGTQDPSVHDFNNLATWGQSYFAMRNLAWACGAPPTDQPNAGTFPIEGKYLTIHLDRGGDLWHMVRRVRELNTDSEAYSKPCMNNEPIGWGELDEPGRRCNDPSIAFCMGVLSRGFEVGLVSHAEHGLHCTPPGNLQTQCHQAAVAGFNVFGVDTRLRFEDVGWANSPVASANIEAGVVNVYSFMDGDAHGWVVLVGLTGDPGIVYKNGFGFAGKTATRPGCEVWEVITGGKPPLVAPNMHAEVQQTMDDHPEIDTLDEAQRGQIIDITCWRVNGGEASPWGRKSRTGNASNPDLNTDGMTYDRGDGLFEIYDVISGVVEGVATWDGTGPYAPGENGYWWPPQGQP